MTTTLKTNKLKHDLIYVTEKIFADAIAKKETENENTKYYLDGLLTPYEYLQTTKMANEFA